MANRETAMWLAGVGLVVLGVVVYLMPFLLIGIDIEVVSKMIPPENVRNTVFMTCILIGGPLSIIGLIHGGARLG